MASMIVCSHLTKAKLLRPQKSYAATAGELVAEVHETSSVDNSEAGQSKGALAWPTNCLLVNEGSKISQPKRVHIIFADDRQDCQDDKNY